MNKTPTLPPVSPNLSAARHEFLEVYGATAVMNNTLKAIVLALSLVCIGLVFAEVRIVQLLRNVKPVVIRVNELGRAEAVAGPAAEYHPQEAEIKYFLIQFVQNHYGRIRATVRDNYSRSLYFLDSHLAGAIIEADKKSKAIETFLTDRTDEIEIRVTSIAIEDLRKNPYRATVDFEKIFYGPDRQEKRREKYIGNFVFMVRDRVPNELIPTNPLGLTITYFREDQTFQP